MRYPAPVIGLTSILSKLDELSNYLYSKVPMTQQIRFFHNKQTTLSKILLKICFSIYQNITYDWPILRFKLQSVRNCATYTLTIILYVQRELSILIYPERIYIYIFSLDISPQQVKWKRLFGHLTKQVLLFSYTIYI